MNLVKFKCFFIYWEREISQQLDLNFDSDHEKSKKKKSIAKPSNCMSIPWISAKKSRLWHDQKHKGLKISKGKMKSQYLKWNNKFFMNIFWMVLTGLPFKCRHYLQFTNFLWWENNKTLCKSCDRYDGESRRWALFALIP